MVTSLASRPGSRNEPKAFAPAALHEPGRVLMLEVMAVQIDFAKASHRFHRRDRNGSAPGFRFTGDQTHPSVIESFRRSIATVEHPP